MSSPLKRLEPQSHHHCEPDLESSRLKTLKEPFRRFKGGWRVEERRGRGKRSSSPFRSLPPLSFLSSRTTTFFLYSLLLRPHQHLLQLPLPSCSKSNVVPSSQRPSLNARALTAALSPSSLPLPQTARSLVSHEFRRDRNS